MFYELLHMDTPVLTKKQTYLQCYLQLHELLHMDTPWTICNYYELLHMDKPFAMCQVKNKLICNVLWTTTYGHTSVD